MRDEALKLALEALEYPLNQSHENFNVDMAELLSHRAIAAIKEVLAQPEQEPVAWVCYGSASDEKHTIDYQQEDIDAVPVGTMLYTTPPQRKPLTDEEIDGVMKSCIYDWGLRQFARAIEAKLKEKNT